MIAETWLRVLNPLPDAFLLLRLSGRIEAANTAAVQLLGSNAVAAGTALQDILDPGDGAASRYLQMCVRSGALLPGALTFRTAEGAVRYRSQAALVQPDPDPLLLLRLQPVASASRQFLVLNEKIQRLNREISQRQRVQEQLELQTTELEHLTSELEQTVEELQQQSEAATVAQQQAEQAAGRFRTLAETSAALTSSLDYATTLRELALAAVRTTADYCTVYLLDEEGRLRRVSGAHADAAKQPLLDRLVAEYPIDASTGGVMSVLTAGQAVLANNIQSEMLERASADSGHLQILRELAPDSSIVAPLRTRERMIGAVAVSRAATRPPFGEEDLTIVEELARRAAMALDNARLYDEAERGNRAKSAFLATMSHELRTPLNAIVGYADLLEAEVSGPIVAAQRQQLSRIRSAADHLRSIIEEILSFARIEANKEQLRVERVELASLVAETTELIRPSLAQRELELRFSAHAPVEVSTDAGKLRQILLNLLGNAVKFTQAGVIGVHVSRTAAGARIVVSDTGIGIPVADMKRIFDPFWQVDHGPTRHAGGAGLGLTVSRRLAELMGGDLSVESELGRGSTFTLTLPDAPPDAV